MSNKTTRIVEVIVILALFGLYFWSRSAVNVAPVAPADVAPSVDATTTPANPIVPVAPATEAPTS